MSKPTRKKVLFLITKSNWGGAQRYVYDLATHLDPAQFEPVVALGGDGTLKEMLQHAGIRVITIDSLERDISLKKEWAFAQELWQILRHERPDILHVNSSKAGGVGTLLGRIARIPRVLFTAHGWAFNEDRPWWQRTLIKALHWLTVLFSHKTIAVSTAMMTQLDWPLIERKMKVIHPGRTIGVMYPKRDARAELISRHPVLSHHQNDPWVMTIAELHPIKRLSVLIDAMQKSIQTHPSLRCVIIGDGQLRAELTAHIERAGLQQHVFLLGSVVEAARFLKAADLFVLPSKSESYGYVLHEAGLAGLPVIATNVGGIPDIIRDGMTGTLVPPDDVPALAHAITSYFDHPKTWLPRTHALQQTMEARSVEHMTTQTSALYLLSLD